MSQIPFLPVPRSPRHDGWSPERQWAFVQALADTGSVSQAARIVGKSVGSANALRRHPLAAEFRAACDAALAQAWSTIEEVALDRVLNGEVETFTRGDGESVERRRPCSDRLLIHLLKTRERAAERRQARREAALAEAARAERVAAMLALAAGETPVAGSGGVAATRSGGTPATCSGGTPAGGAVPAADSPLLSEAEAREALLAAFHAGGGGFADWPDLAPGLVATPAGLRPDPGPPVELAPADGRLSVRIGRPPRLRPPRAPLPRPTAAERQAARHAEMLRHIDELRQAAENGPKLVREQTSRGVRVRWV